MKENSKKIYIILAILIIGIIALISIYILCNNKSYEIEQISEFKYFKIYENNKYGIIDDKGNILVEAKYDKIDIPNPSKSVFIVYFNYNNESGEYESQVINEKNEKLLTNYEKVHPLMFKDSNSEVPYEKSVLKYEKGNKYGIIDFNGKKITEPIYDSIETLLYKEGCLLVEENNKYGIINIKGKVVIKPEYDGIIADGYYEEETKYKKAGFIVTKKKDEGYRYGYINSNGNIILKPEYNELHRITEETEKDIYILAFKNKMAGIYINKKQILEHEYEEIEYDIKNKLFIVQKSSKQGVYDKKGNKILDTIYDYIMISGNRINTKKEDVIKIYDINGNEKNTDESSTILSTENEEYFINIDKNEKFGIINKNGDVLIENKYNYIEFIFDNTFIVSLDGVLGVIDINENIKLPFEYGLIQKIMGTDIILAMSNTDNAFTELYNNKLEKIDKIENPNIYPKDNYIKILTKNDIIYLDKQGNKLSSKDIFVSNNLIPVKKEDKWGFMDRQGNIKIDAIYDLVTEFNEYGYAGIKKDGKWGVVDAQENIIKEPSYNIEWDNPEFIGKYIKINYEYGFTYYTKDLINI